MNTKIYTKTKMNSRKTLYNPKPQESLTNLSL